jgi:hypothetical protein
LSSSSRSPHDTPMQSQRRGGGITGQQKAAAALRTGKAWYPLS